MLECCYVGVAVSKVERYLVFQVVSDGLVPQYLPVLHSRSMSLLKRLCAFLKATSTKNPFVLGFPRQPNTSRFGIGLLFVVTPALNELRGFDPYRMGFVAVARSVGTGVDPDRNCTRVLKTDLKYLERPLCVQAAFVPKIFAEILDDRIWVDANFSYLRNVF